MLPQGMLALMLCTPINMYAFQDGTLHQALNPSPADHQPSSSDEEPTTKPALPSGNKMRGMEVSKGLTGTWRANARGGTANHSAPCRGD